MAKNVNPDPATSSLLDLTSKEMEAMAKDTSQPFVLRKLIEMVSSENQAIAMQAIKYIKDREAQPTSDQSQQTDDTALQALITDMGIVGYPVEKILSILPDDVDHEDFIKNFNDPTSDIARWYKRGVDIADFRIDKQLFNQSLTGDLNALSEFERRKRRRSDDD